MCESENVAYISAKCDDRCHIVKPVLDEYHFKIDVEYIEEYVPHDLGIGGGDYVKFHFCLDCRSIVGDFPGAEKRG